MATGAMDGGKEFICGNRDGQGGRSNATYNVCRVGVGKEALRRETEAGFHPRSVVLGSQKLDCPASRMARTPYDAPTPAALESSGLEADRDHLFELIQEQDGDGGYLVCRLGVPRPRLVEEVEAKLHEGYKLVTVGGTQYVQAKANKTEKDNVNQVGKPWTVPVNGTAAGRKGPGVESVWCPLSRIRGVCGTH